MTFFGLEIRGMSALSIFESAERKRFRALVEDCLAGPRVGVLDCAAATPEGAEIALEIMMAPLRSDFDQVNHMLGAIHVLSGEKGGVATAPRRCRIYRRKNPRLLWSRPSGSGRPLAQLRRRRDAL